MLSKKNDIFYSAWCKKQTVVNWAQANLASTLLHAFQQVS